MTAKTAAVKITIVVDNRANEGLLCEHGFSAWIEVPGRRLLFDTGQGAALPTNADKIGIDLRTADIVVLSHGHYDHSGGLPLVITRAPTAEIYAHPAATGLRYAIRDGTAKPIAMPTAQMTPTTTSERCLALRVTAAMTIAAKSEKESVPTRKGQPKKRAKPIPP